MWQISLNHKQAGSFRMFDILFLRTDQTYKTEPILGINWLKWVEGVCENKGWDFERRPQTFALHSKPLSEPIAWLGNILNKEILQTWISS